MGKIYSTDLICVEFKGAMDDDLNLNEGSSEWGFAISQEGRSAFVPIGTKVEMEKEILKRKDNLPWLILDALRLSIDEVASELLCLLLDGNEGMIINGQVFDQDEVEQALGMSPGF